VPLTSVRQALKTSKHMSSSQVRGWCCDVLRHADNQGRHELRKHTKLLRLTQNKNKHALHSTHPAYHIISCTTSLKDTLFACPEDLFYRQQACIRPPSSDRHCSSKGTACSSTLAQELHVCTPCRCSQEAIWSRMLTLGHS
jgi:hypothetical protein